MSCRRCGNTRTNHDICLSCRDVRKQTQYIEDLEKENTALKNKVKELEDQLADTRYDSLME